MNPDVILIVNDPAALTWEKTIEGILKVQLKYQVSVIDAKSSLPALTGIKLVVVCADHVLAVLRGLHVPILVCNPHALFDLGMTFAKDGVDFGTQSYADIFITPGSVGKPLAGFIGQQTITSTPTNQGWAKPGGGALVVATVSGNSEKTVVFAYNKGDAMPCLDAVHNRVAFLAVGDAHVPMNANGALLFEKVARGIYDGDQWAAPPGLAGLWFLREGVPTRSLTQDEYRAWVHEQVERKVGRQLWKRLSIINTVVGSISLVVLVTIIVSVIGWINTSITTQVQTETDRKAHDAAEKADQKADQKIEKVRVDLKERLQGDVATQMAQLLFVEGSPIRKKVEEKLKVQVENLIKTDEKTKQQLRDVATEELLKSGKTAETFLSQFNAIPRGTQAKKRDLLLRLSIVYATERQGDTLHKLVKKIIVDDQEDERIRVTALENYEPEKGNEPENDKDFRAVLQAFDHKRPNPVLREALGSFFANFKDDHAEPLLTWLHKNYNYLFVGDAKSMLFNAIKLKQTKGQDGPKVLNQLVGMVLDKQPDNYVWARAALVLLSQENIKWEITDKQRQALVWKLCVRANDFSGKQEDILPSPSQAFEYKDHNTILQSLFKGNADADFVISKLSGGERADSKAFQILLFNWAAVLEKQKEQGYSKEILEKLYTIRDLFKGVGTARLLAYYLRNAEAKVAQQFFEKFPELEFATNIPAKLPYSTDNLLVAALEGDARASFAGTQAMLKRVAANPIFKGDPRNKIMGKVKSALVRYASMAYRQPEDLVGLRVALAAVDQEKEMRDLFKEALIKAYENLTRQAESTKKWDVAIKLYRDWIQQDPDKPSERYYKLGKIYYDDLQDYPETLSYLTKAIDLDQNKFAYFLTRGDVHCMIEGKIDKAIEDYEQALKKWDATRDSPYDKGTGHNRLALAYVLKPDENQVKAQVQKAVEAFPLPQNKAWAKENLGLFYLTQQKWDSAFNNTTDATRLYSYTPWNWIIRFIAAREKFLKTGKKQDEEAATTAYQTWLLLQRPNDLTNLNLYIPRLLEKHLNVVAVKPARLQAGFSFETRFGKNSLANVHTIPMKRSKKYIIDMESSVVDSYLFLQDSSGKYITENDDGAGGLNARIEYTPEADGEYRIIATSLAGKSQGAYTLIVREIPEGK